MRLAAPRPGRGSEKLAGRVSKLEGQLAQQTERADVAERALEAVQEEQEEQLAALQQSAEQRLAAAQAAAAQAREQTEAQTARWVGCWLGGVDLEAGAGAPWCSGCPCLTCAVSAVLAPPGH